MSTVAFVSRKKISTWPLDLRQASASSIAQLQGYYPEFLEGGIGVQVNEVQLRDQLFVKDGRIQLDEESAEWFYRDHAKSLKGPFTVQQLRMMESRMSGYQLIKYSPSGVWLTAQFLFKVANRKLPPPNPISRTSTMSSELSEISRANTEDIISQILNIRNSIDPANISEIPKFENFSGFDFVRSGSEFVLYAVLDTTALILYLKKISELVDEFKQFKLQNVKFVILWNVLYELGTLKSMQEIGSYAEAAIQFLRKNQKSQNLLFQKSSEFKEILSKLGNLDESTSGEEKNSQQSKLQKTDDGTQQLQNTKLDAVVQQCGYYQNQVDERSLKAGIVLLSDDTNLVDVTIAQNVNAKLFQSLVKTRVGDFCDKLFGIFKAKKEIKVRSKSQNLGNQQVSGQIDEWGSNTNTEAGQSNNDGQWGNLNNSQSSNQVMASGGDWGGNITAADTGADWGQGMDVAAAGTDWGTSNPDPKPSSTATVAWDSQESSSTPTPTLAPKPEIVQTSFSGWGNPETNPQSSEWGDPFPESTPTPTSNPAPAQNQQPVGWGDTQKTPTPENEWGGTANNASASDSDTDWGTDVSKLGTSIDFKQDNKQSFGSDQSQVMDVQKNSLGGESTGAKPQSNGGGLPKIEENSTWNSSQNQLGNNANWGESKVDKQPGSENSAWNQQQQTADNKSNQCQSSGNQAEQKNSQDDGWGSQDVQKNNLQSSSWGSGSVGGWGIPSDAGAQNSPQNLNASMSLRGWQGSSEKPKSFQGSQVPELVRKSDSSQVGTKNSQVESSSVNENRGSINTNNDVSFKNWNSAASKDKTSKNGASGWGATQENVSNPDSAWGAQLDPPKQSQNVSDTWGAGTANTKGSSTSWDGVQKAQNLDGWGGNAKSVDNGGSSWGGDLENAQNVSNTKQSEKVVTVYRTPKQENQNSGQGNFGSADTKNQQSGGWDLPKKVTNMKSTWGQEPTRGQQVSGEGQNTWEKGNQQQQKSEGGNLGGAWGSDLVDTKKLGSGDWEEQNRTGFGEDGGWASGTAKMGQSKSAGDEWFSSQQSGGYSKSKSEPRIQDSIKSDKKGFSKSGSSKSFSGVQDTNVLSRSSSGLAEIDGAKNQAEREWWTSKSDAVKGGNIETVEGGKKNEGIVSMYGNRLYKHPNLREKLPAPHEPPPGLQQPKVSQTGQGAYASIGGRLASAPIPATTTTKTVDNPQQQPAEASKPSLVSFTQSEPLQRISQVDSESLQSVSRAESEVLTWDQLAVLLLQLHTVVKRSVEQLSQTSSFEKLKLQQMVEASKHVLQFYELFQSSFQGGKTAPVSQQYLQHLFNSIEALCKICDINSRLNRESLREQTDDQNPDVKLELFQQEIDYYQQDIKKIESMREQ